MRDLALCGQPAWRDGQPPGPCRLPARGAIRAARRRNAGRGGGPWSPGSPAMTCCACPASSDAAPA